ncbi:MAG: hypothetical protein SFX18_12340 [Pirellulales bacterium]|nr:hypothetical protein [Pirellulales bacterium]
MNLNERSRPAQKIPTWLDRFRAKQAEPIWNQAWQLFSLYRGSVELERAYLHQNQKMDLYAYAERFGLAWPRLN